MERIEKYSLLRERILKRFLASKENSDLSSKMTRESLIPSMEESFKKSFSKASPEEIALVETFVKMGLLMDKKEIFAKIKAATSTASLGSRRGKILEIEVEKVLRSWCSRNDAKLIPQYPVEWTDSLVDFCVVLSDGSEIYLPCTTKLFSGTTQNQRSELNVKLITNRPDIGERLLLVVSNSIEELPAPKNSKASHANWDLLEKLENNITYISEIETKLNLFL